MTLNISTLNNATFNELTASVPIQIGNGLTNVSGVYTATQNNQGNLAIFDSWTGASPSSPAPLDVTTVHTITEAVVPSNAPFGVIEYMTTQANGTVNPASGGFGAEIVAWNATGVLVEQLPSYVPGATSVSPNGSYVLLAAPGVDLSIYTGAGPTAAELTFATTGAFPNLQATPEPSMALMMPLMVVLLMISRNRSVRSFFGANQA